MEFTMTQDKVTKGAIRYADGGGHNLYLRKEEAATIGNPESIKVTIESIK